ncbi:MAG: amidohydrolase family protein [Bacillota bacterium]|nr:amidohydrolase family protein [Bacillota bacterium]
MRIVDVHGHIGNWGFPMRCSTVNHLVDFMMRCGIERTIVSHSLAITYDFVEGNRKLAEAIEDQDGVWGYLVLNPHYVQRSLVELDRYRDNPKFIGVKLHPEQQGYRLMHRNVLEILERVSELRLPVLVHTFPGQIDGLCQAAKEFPDVKFIMGHMGGNDWVAGIEAAAQRRNIWLEPCSSFPDAGKISQAIDTVGVERLLFGSDSTLLNPAFIWGMLRDAGLSQDDLQQIAWKNAADVFHF